MAEGERILGVDDSLTIRKALELVLKPAGYQLELAASGEEAVQKAKDFRPSIVLLDFILPDMRGTEVCRRLAADPETASIPIVLISAKGAEIRQAYQDVGNVVSYITKPFTPEDLTGAVTETLARVAEAGETPIVSVPTVEPPAPQETEVDTQAPEVTRSGPTVEGEAPTPAAVDMAGGGASRVEAASDDLGVSQYAPAPPPVVTRREAMEEMFESLRAGLEGVYVEEVDTPAGAAADEARTYTQLVSKLTRQLSETLVQARSGTHFTLSHDGSVRSLGENLLDAYRRVCRLLFRAAAAGAVEQQTARTKARVLVICRRESPVFETLERIGRGGPQAYGLVVADRFGQLPMVTRLYGPTHLIVEAVTEGAIWEQLRILRSMPEAKRFRLLVAAPAAAAVDHQAFEGIGAEAVLEDGPEFLVQLGQRLSIVPREPGPDGAVCADAELTAKVG